MLMLFIWVIGILYTLGRMDFKEKDVETIDKVLAFIVTLILWPYLLGKFDENGRVK